ncbi:MAG: 1-acyl-sn-glycerol-3-phosphate acyltransferase [Synechococcales cyanobacterium T60_A2020_003]|nr:1-acyl-sn-glycerol-3-phosphate acyltransferase [Synechococcales cyanobacterium T60_A2020_003]
MPMTTPLSLSQTVLASLETKASFYYQSRIPANTSLVVVSNHRSFMDAMLLMAAMERDICFACHRYMGQVPVLSTLIQQLGCFPLDKPDRRQRDFFTQATLRLQTQQAVGIFPEGAQPMVRLPQQREITAFHRGFAHLALRSPVERLGVLPVAIAPHREVTQPMFPLQMLSWFDASEPLFTQGGWHPLVVYQDVSVLFGEPIWITSSQRTAYQGKQARSVVTDLTEQCRTEIYQLLRRGHWD